MSDIWMSDVYIFRLVWDFVLDINDFNATQFACVMMGLAKEEVLIRSQTFRILLPTQLSDGLWKVVYARFL